MCPGVEGKMTTVIQDDQICSHEHIPRVFVWYAEIYRTHLSVLSNEYPHKYAHAVRYSCHVVSGDLNRLN